MAKIDGVVREVIDKSEWVAIATAGPDGPHLSATWGDYVRALGVEDDTVMIPAGGMLKTEANLQKNPRVELLFASRQVPRPHGMGQGCLLSGTAELLLTGPRADAARSRFPWARGVLVVKVERASTQI
jgi:predicted pyridoxine 5'-phosphate oxidase superfamily flavin-nucleotide-binding protein